MSKQSGKESKNKVRQSLLQKRRQLSPQEQKIKSAHIVKIVKQSDEFKRAKNIAFYHAVRGEADPLELAPSDFTATNKQFFLPVISSNQTNCLTFSPVNNDTQYKNTTVPLTFIASPSG